MKQRILDVHRVYRAGLLVLVAAGVPLISVTWLLAAPLPPGSTLHPVPSGPVPGGNAVAGGVPVSFQSATFNGTLTSTVLENDPTNPLGGLTFTYLLEDDSASQGAIEFSRIGSFAGVSADVDYVPGDGHIPPAYFDRSSGAGATIGYAFVPPTFGFGQLQPGQSSELVVYTNSHVFAATTAAVTDGSGTTVASYATPAIPGDVNFDGIVNGLDIALVASHWLETGLAGDANYDGVVNGLDVALIASHWLQTGAGGGSATVPEPPAILLATIGVVALLGIRCRCCVLLVAEA